MNKFLILVSLTWIIACAPSGQQTPATEKENVSQEDLKTELDQLEAVLKNSKSAKIDQVKAKLLIEKSIEYVNAFPKNKESVGYLFRAAEVSVGIKKFDQAISYFEKVQEDYPEHEKAPIALFLQGFTSENNTKKIDQAKQYYNRFLAKYPDHDLNDQVKILLKNIDTSPEDLIKSFKKKGQSKE